MENKDTKATPSPAPSSPESNGSPKRNKRRSHLIHPTWLRRSLKSIGGVILFILLLPVLLYIPPVQTLLKNVACDFVKKSTGMQIGIDRFRLRFPLDVELDGVSVVEASGDTMVRARSAVADVKILPLLGLDVKLNRLQLLDGYYRMVSPDSSMIMTIDAGFLQLDDKSSANIAASEININKALLKRGRISLFMDVWKKQPSPADSTSTPFLIRVNDASLHDIDFAMSMLPTIDTLTIAAADLNLKQAVIDLRTNRITAASLTGSKGAAKYITPTPEYIAAHPAPADTVSPPSPPMVIMGDTVGLSDFKVLYAVKGARPSPGLDPSYLQLSGVTVGLADFYNEASTVVLPVRELAAKERCGLQVTSGEGTVRVDSLGLKLENLHVETPWSDIRATADLPFSLMALQPGAPVNAKAVASVGMPDVEAFMPDVKTFTSKLPRRSPLKLALDARGTLSDVEIPALTAAMTGVFSLKAKGKAQNPMDFKRLIADLQIDGALENPSIVQQFTGPLGFELPTLAIKGTATARGQEYGADFNLLTSAGNLAAQGHVGLNSERYDADLRLREINVAHFMPALGIGKVSANITAHGAGFNPLKGGAATEAGLDVISIDYKGNHLTDIVADASIHNGVYTLSARSPNPLIDFDIDGTGSIDNGMYTFDITADINHADLRTLGITPDICEGKGSIYLAGSANPEKWLYDVDMKLGDLEWSLPGQFISLPYGMTARLDAGENDVQAYVNSNLTSLDLHAYSGLKYLVDGVTAVADSALVQISRKNLDVEALRARLPQFRMDMAASGRGVLREFLTPAGIGIDTLNLTMRNDSLISADVFAYGIRDGQTRVDSITFNLQQRGQLLGYKAHMGNRPGTMDEFARVDVGGYVGGNRAAINVTQHNIQGEMGYRLGFTAAMLDQAIELHFTPLKATIAYMPWTLNADNHVEYRYSGEIDANLLAKSNESSILLMTEKADDGVDELHVKLDNIKIQDFLRMSIYAPPVTASVNSDMRVRYTETALSGGGDISVRDFTYDKLRVGDFDLTAKAGMNVDGHTNAEAALKIDGKPALALHSILAKDSVAGFQPEELGLTLTNFPLKVVNPFIGADMLTLSGGLDGNLELLGSFSNPILNGKIACDSVSAYIPMAGTRLKFDREPIVVDSNLVRFNAFDITAVNDNPITIDGIVNARDFSDIRFDIGAKGSNVQLVGVDKRARTDLYGKLFLDLDASARGPMKHFDLKANVGVLNTTDIYYNLNIAQGELTEQSADNVVKFVQFNDTTNTAKADSIENMMAMRIIANLNINPGTMVTVNLSNNGTDKAQISPSGNLNYFQNFMGDMRLNGVLNLGAGMARYTLPLVGERSVTINPSSKLTWNGDVMNPVLDLSATNVTKATIVSGGNSSLVNFDIGINVTNTLAAPKLAFTLSTQDDMTVENEITAMTPDQRSNQAMNLLLYGRYTGPGTRTDGAPATAMLYSFLSSQLNSWAAQNIRGVDLSFGINQYDKTVNGQNSTTMSYSYQVSKSLFNNKFKIVVGGQYATDDSSDENLADNLLSDISFEYMIKQTQSVTMLAKLFRHTGFESILEGEITETGVGFVMKRQLQSLKSFFRNPFARRRKRKPAVETDSTLNVKSLPSDSITSKDDKDNEKK